MTHLLEVKRLVKKYRREGLGFLIGQAEDNRRYDLMFVAIMMIGVAGFTSDRALL